MRVQSTEQALVPSLPDTPAAATSASRSPPRNDGPSPFSKLVRGLGTELDRGEATVRQALRGSSTSDPAALLALQAGVYRYVEAVDLASKLVDRASSAVKTTLQSQ
jgi:hypothetical protein